MALKNHNNHSDKAFDWKSVAGGFVSSFTSNFMEKFVDKIKMQIQQTFHQVQKNIAGMFLMFLGIVFLLVGLANMVDRLLDLGSGIGYAIMGLLAFLFGYIIIKK